MDCGGREVCVESARRRGLPRRPLLGSTSRGGTMPLPDLTPEQRQQALDKAAEVRRERAELKDQLKHGGTTLDSVLRDAEDDDVVGKKKIQAVLESLPGVGKVRAQRIMERLGIAET